MLLDYALFIILVVMNKIAFNKKTIVSLFVIAFCLYIFGGIVYLISNSYIKNGSLNIKNNYHLCLKRLDTPSVNLIGGIQYVLDQKVFKTPFRTVVRLNNDHYAFVLKPVDYSYPQNKIVKLDKWLKTRNCRFVFLIAPHQICKFDTQLPRGIYDYCNQTGDKFLEELEKNNVAYLDSRELFRNSPELHYRYFIRNDSHWKNYYAFKFFLIVAKYMREECKFEFPDEILDENMYSNDIEQLTFGDMNLFVGSFFHENDFNITPIPKYSTDIDWTINNQSGSGVFDYKKLNNLFCCQTHNRNISGKKVLLLSDSYGLAFRPYVSLICRDYQHISLNQFELQKEALPPFLELIEQFQPDVVLFMGTPRDFPKMYYDYINVPVQ